MLELRKETLDKLEDFLSTIPSKFTRKNYKAGIKRFEDWYEKSITTVIKDPEAYKTVNKFYVFLKEKFCQNTARNQTNAVIQFLKFYDVELPKKKLRKDIYRTEESTDDHQLTILDLQKMNAVANLREQVLLEIGLLGFRIQDVVTLKKENFDVLELESPIPINIRARKEGTIYKTFISKELKDLLILYLPTLKGEYLFEGSKSKTHQKDETFNKNLQDLSQRANIKLHGNLHWHCFRKLVMRSGQELRLSHWSIKAMVGKSISKSDETYLLGADLKEDFLKVHEYLKLKVSNGNGRIKGMQEELRDYRKVMQVLARYILKEIKESKTNIRDMMKAEKPKKPSKDTDEAILEAFLESEKDEM